MATTGMMASALLTAEDDTAGDPTVWFGQKRLLKTHVGQSREVAGRGKAFKTAMRGGYQPSSYLDTGPKRSNQHAAPDMTREAESEMWSCGSCRHQPMSEPFAQVSARIIIVGRPVHRPGNGGRPGPPCHYTLL